MYNGDLITQKKEIRRKMRQLRDSLSAHDIYSKSNAIQAKLWQLIEEQQEVEILGHSPGALADKFLRMDTPAKAFPSPSTGEGQDGGDKEPICQSTRFEAIMFYIAFGSEVRTQDCIARTIDSGRTAIVPICSTDGKRQLIPSRLLDLQSEVAESRFGIPEPKPEFQRPFPPEKIDLVVVPGLAFSEDGYRIGHGAGYYDRFLPRCPQALLVGLAYEMQIVECTFPSEWDIPVHKIITEDRVVSCKM